MNSVTAYRISVGACLAMAVMLALHFAFPVHTQAQYTAAKEKQRKDTEAKIVAARAKVKDLKQKNADRLWDLTPAEVSTEVMALVSNAAKNLKVTVTNFRPQRATDEKNVRQLPFVATIEGRFAAITAFCSALDAPAKKVVLKSLQINAADPNKETVTASIGLVAYVPLDTPAK